MGEKRPLPDCYPCQDGTSEAKVAWQWTFSSDNARRGNHVLRFVWTSYGRNQR